MAPVMDAALAAGADLANDIWGLRYDKFYTPRERHPFWDCGTMALDRCKYDTCPRYHNRDQAVYPELSGGSTSDLEDSIAIGEKAGSAGTE